MSKQGSSIIFGLKGLWLLKSNIELFHKNLMIFKNNHLTALEVEATSLTTFSLR